MESKVQIRPLPVERWHGKTGKESFAGTFTLTPLVDSTTGSYKTGMTREEIEEYSKKLNIDLTPRHNRLKPHEFWDSESAAIRLENRTNFVDKNDPLGFVHYKTLLASKYVANSMREWEQGEWPEAIFVIVDEETDSEIKASKIALTKDAIISTSKLSKDRKAALILILAGKMVRGKSDNFIEVELDELIRKNPEEVLKVIEMDSKKMVTHAMVLEAIQRNHLDKAGHRIMYMDSVLGDDIYSTVDYLEKPENQDLKLRIQNLINS